jgi:transcriptional regulator with XRE-family HTH domain
MSQEELAKAAKVTFQQMQKYERGTNRVSISRALRIARALDCRLVDLLGDLETDAGPCEVASDSPARLLTDPAAQSLVEAFAKVNSKKLRSQVISLVRELADGGRKPERE